MCEVSDKLKLCSCKTESVEKLRHYWVLMRPFKRGDNIIGTIMAPADIGEKAEKFNFDSLRRQLNNGSCFDVELTHQEKDILELHFTCRQPSLSGEITSFHEGYLVYAFTYKNGKWRKSSYDPFGNNIYPVQGGKISSPFSRSDP